MTQTPDHSSTLTFPIHMQGHSSQSQTKFGFKTTLYSTVTQAFQSRIYVCSCSKKLRSSWQGIILSEAERSEQDWLKRNMWDMACYRSEEGVDDIRRSWNVGCKVWPNVGMSSLNMSWHCTPQLLWKRKHSVWIL
jgi:hypothetical protein